MMRAWRLAPRTHSDPPRRRAFSGRGAEIFGGRWNPVGIAAAYASGSRALAALEFLVHTDRDVLPSDLVLSEVAFDDADIERAAPPDGWDIAGSAGAVTYGEQWLRAERSLVLAVPSVLVPDEPNYVINPRHRRAKSLVVSPLLRPFIYDERLLRK
jgi:RES domain-containing protein